MTDSRQTKLNVNETRNLKELSKSYYFHSLRDNTDAIIEQSPQRRLSEVDKMVYEEVKGADRVWDLKEESVIEGVLEKFEQSIHKKPDGSPRMNYILREDKGTILVWGSTVLDNIEKIKLGTKIKIEFLGEVKGKSGMMYRDFKVYEDK